MQEKLIQRRFNYRGFQVRLYTVENERGMDYSVFWQGKLHKYEVSGYINDWDELKAVATEDIDTTIESWERRLRIAIGVIEKERSRVRDRAS